jgi:ABC-2 type transport system ATP-binding protein
MNYSPAVVVNDLVVRRGRSDILRGVDAHIPEGQVVGLLGPSGAGKTTLMRTIIGAQRTASGTVEVFGRPAGHAALRRELGYMAQSSAIYDDLTVEQNLDYFRRVLGAPKTDVARVVDEVGLGSVRRNLAAQLSGGQRSRVSLGIALLGAPRSGTTSRRGCCGSSCCARCWAASPGRSMPRMRSSARRSPPRRSWA